MVRYLTLAVLLLLGATVGESAEVPKGSVEVPSAGEAIRCLSADGLSLVDCGADPFKSEIAGKSSSSTVDSFTVCTGQFNVVLDANELVALTSLPPGGQFARLCWIHATIHAGAAAAADFAIWEGTTSSTPCDASSPQVVMGDWSFDKTVLPGIKLGEPNGPIVAITAARILCAKSTNATGTNKIRVVGTYAIY